MADGTRFDVIYKSVEAFAKTHGLDLDAGLQRQINAVAVPEHEKPRPSDVSIYVYHLIYEGMKSKV